MQIRQYKACVDLMRMDSMLDMETARLRVQELDRQRRDKLVAARNLEGVLSAMANEALAQRLQQDFKRLDFRGLQLSSLHAAILMVKDKALSGRKACRLAGISTGGHNRIAQLAVRVRLHRWY